MASKSSSTSGPDLLSSDPVTSVAELAEQFRDFHGTSILNLATPGGTDAIPVIVLPAGKAVSSVKPFVDEWRGRPERREGTARLLDLASFVAHTNRFKDADSALFANPSPTEPSVTAVLDYHQALEGRDGEDALPRFGRHRAHYPCPLSEEWKAWRGLNGTSMEQARFAEILEDRITDVVTAPARDEAPGLHATVDAMGGRLGGPQSLHALSRGLMINVSSAVKQAITLETGEVSILYDEVHNDGTGAPLKTPNLFVLQIPIFLNGPLYWLPVRLRYRLSSGKITWSFHLYRADRLFKDAFDEITASAAALTELPLYVGTPEA